MSNIVLSALPNQRVIIGSGDNQEIRVKVISVDAERQRARFLISTPEGEAMHNVNHGKSFPLPGGVTLTLEKIYRENKEDDFMAKLSISAPREIPVNREHIFHAKLRPNDPINTYSPRGGRIMNMDYAKALIITDVNAGEVARVRVSEVCNDPAPHVVLTISEAGKADYTAELASRQAVSVAGSSIRLYSMQGPVLSVTGPNNLDFLPQESPVGRPAGHQL